MRHMKVLLQLFAHSCIASSPHQWRVKDQISSFRRKQSYSSNNNAALADSPSKWSQIHSTRGGASLDLSGDDGLRDLPDRVDESSIQMIVDEIIQDGDANIILLPDRIEAGLYRNTVRMTLNAIYKVLKIGDGRSFLLGHEFKMRHYPATLGKTEAFHAAQSNNNVNMSVLVEVADRLLQNKNINQPLIPDAVERQIYINCLKVVFRILDIVQGSLRVNVCGHSVGLFLGKSTTNKLTIPPENSVRRAASIISKVSQDDLLRYHEESGVLINKPNYSRLSFWDRRKRDMMNQVHATLFGLVVQIVQDMLDESTIEFVGVGKIVIDLIPSSGGKEQKSETAKLDKNKVKYLFLQQVVVPMKKRISTFVLGMGVGAVLVVLLIKQLESADGKIMLGIDQLRFG